MSLKGAILKDAEAKKYWDMFSEIEKDIIISPETNYTGLSAEKARLIAANWKSKI